MYYTHDGGERKGHILISRACSVKECPTHKYPNTFYIYDAQTEIEIYLCAESVEEMKTWVSKIGSVIKEEKDPGSTEPASLESLAISPSDISKSAESSNFTLEADVDVSVTPPSPPALQTAETLSKQANQVTETDSCMSHTGMLKKRGRVVPTWRTRYFVLDGNSLMYYTHDGGERKGHILISRACSVKECPTHKYPNTFYIYDAQTEIEIYLCAESVEEMKTWVSKIGSVIKEEKDPGSTEPASLESLAV